MSPRRRTPGGPTDGPAATAQSDGTAPFPVHATPDRIVDPRAVRVALGASAAHARIAPIVIEPPAIPLAPAPHVTGTGVLGGVAAPSVGLGHHPDDTGGVVIVDGEPTHLRLDRSGPVHAVLVDGLTGPVRTRVLLMPPDEPPTAGEAGVRRREVVVDGWLVELDVESERRASLRERARRGGQETAHGGTSEVHAIIPGRVVSVSVVAGDPVVAGQQLLVVEAMKMQNELRAPRDGVISRVAVGVGVTIEVGDLMLVLE
jgi:biotin carboxyl carrier protein